MAFETIVLEKKDGIARITLNRPDVLNALNTQVFSELDAAFDDVAGDDNVAVIILTGAGAKAFAAGADISELADQKPIAARRTAARGQHIMRKLETMGKPSIAAVNGFALGGGCELAMACSIRIASENARFGQPEVNLGVIPGYAGTQRLPRLVGKGVATELLLTGRMVDANEALRIGLVTRVVPADELATATDETAATLLTKGPLALAAALDVIDRGYDMNLDDASELEANAFGVLASSEDMAEGMKAFLEKRKPEFKGK